jgi:hypothetical protein
MVIVAFLFALSCFLFKYFAIETDTYWALLFWENIGFVICAFIFFFFVKNYRRSFLTLVKTAGSKIIAFNFTNEVFAITGKFVLNYASLFIPLALAMLATGFQPFFIFIWGIFLTLFFPRFFKEDISRSLLIQKFAFISIIFIGICLLSFEA